MKKIIPNKTKYISASQINCFIENRDQFFRNYVLGNRWEANAYFGRGNAIEKALDAAIDGMDDNSAMDLAWEYYENYKVENGLTQAEFEKVPENVLRDMVLAAVIFYKHELGAGPAVSKQEDFSVKIDGIARPIYGKMDYRFPSDGPFAKGCVRDLKGASKTPSKLSDRYKLQGTVYNMATGEPVIFDHIVWLKSSGAKVVSIALKTEDIAEYQPIVRAVAKAMEDLWNFIPDEIDEDYMEAFHALSFPNIFGMWNETERKKAIEQYVTSQ